MIKITIEIPCAEENPVDISIRPVDKKPQDDYVIRPMPISGMPSDGVGEVTIGHKKTGSEMSKPESK